MNELLCTFCKEKRNDFAMILHSHEPPLFICGPCGIAIGLAAQSITQRAFLRMLESNYPKKDTGDAN